MIRRFLTRILMVVLLAFCGYNWLQVRSLQMQVADLQNRMAVRDRQTKMTSAEMPLPALLKVANNHVVLARTALARSDWKTAHRELEQGMENLNQASRSPDALWRKANSLAGRISH